MKKWINIGLIIIVVILGLETTANILGRIALIQNNFEKARFYLSMIRHRELMGFVYYKQNRFEEAFNYYQQTKNWRGMGWAYYGMGKYEEAQDYFQKVDDYAGLGQVKIAKGEYEEAKDFFYKSNDSSGLGLTHIADKNYQKAKEKFIEAGDLFGLGLLYICKGDKESALKVFQSIDNDIAKMIVSLLGDDFKNSLKILEKIGDDYLLGQFWIYRGDYNRALKHFKELNDINYLSHCMIHLDQIPLLQQLFEKSDYEMRQVDLINYIGHYESSHELYHQLKNFKDAFDSLVHLNRSQSIQYAEKILQQFPDEHEIKLKLSDLYRLNKDFKKSQLILNQFDSIIGYKPYSMIYQARLDKYSDKKNYNQHLQSSINLYGQSDLSSLLVENSTLYGYQLKKPNKEQVNLFVQGTPLKMIKVLLILLGIIIIAVFITVIVKRIKEKPPELEDITGRPSLSKAHKKIYADKTPLNLEVKSKLQKNYSSEVKVISESGSEPSSDQKESTISSEALNKIEKSGVQILQLALKKLGIITTAFELIELAGEQGGKLTVYGIYLAARAKGAQVQGIKVDLDYLKEQKEGIHLVFFEDESFALMNEIKDTEIELVWSPDSTKIYTKQDFLENWNGYVITLSKG